MPLHSYIFKRAAAVHIHILGICGTFMGSMAILARELGHKVTGCDANVYPPMSTQLQEQGIELMQGYKAEHLKPAPDLVVVGNALSRGNEAVEYVLDNKIPYISGAQWLKENVLKDKWVLAIAGTHGKTTTASMLTWILEYANYTPGYLIGGVPNNFSVSARMGESDFFVIEADEYDTAFFDKRSKFVHYVPNTAVINNIEFDHADIFDDIKAIQKQFHHLVRIVPSNGQVIFNAEQETVKQTLEMGCWSDTLGVLEQNSSNAGFDSKLSKHKHEQCSFELLREDGTHFALYLGELEIGEVNWSLTGTHNVYNATMAIMAARHAGVRPEHAIEALHSFSGVKRRMELLGNIDGVRVYDDFAHHPTAITNTLQGLRKNVGDDAQIIAVIEPRSNTMRLGCHTEKLSDSVDKADHSVWYQPQGLDWQLENLFADQGNMQVVESIDNVIESIIDVLDESKEAHIVIMSNGGFGGVHQQLLASLKSRALEAQTA